MAELASCGTGEAGRSPPRWRGPAGRGRRREGRGREGLAERLESFDRIPERAVPPGLDAELRDYQHRGYRWLCALHDPARRILADDMGLGKTVQTLASWWRCTAPCSLSLVVAPTSVVPNWAMEVARFAPGLRAAIHHGSDRGEPPPTWTPWS
ncbi:MAG: SNF2-related protein [bacterium]